MKWPAFIPLLGSLVVSVATMAEEPMRGSWPQFRGPTGQGVVENQSLPLKWSEGEGVRWKRALTGRGWSSPVVANGRIWLTAAVEVPADEQQRGKMLAEVAKYPIGDEMIAVESIELLALEVDFETGELLRQVKLFTVEAPPPIHGLNSYASPTPVLADGKLVCHFGAFGTACVDVETCEILWKRQFEINHIVGPGSSPVVADGLVLLTSDGGDKQFITALKLDSGEPRWQRDRPPIREANPDMRKAFSTPLVVDVGGRRQAVIPGAQWFISYDTATGDEVWRVDHGNGFSNVPRPVFDGERFYLCTGFGKPQLWAVRADGRGDVTETHVQWRQKQQVPAKSSPLVSEGRLYMISDGGVASCLDTATGNLLWRERIPGQYSASPLSAHGRIYFCSHEGRTTVVADAPKFQQLAANQLDGMLMASPAAVDGALILRTDSHLYRVGE